MTNLQPIDKHLPKTPKRRGKGRPSAIESVQLRAMFLDEALKEFLEKGFAGSSIEGIARRAKVSKNTVYLQFKSKEALFLAASEQGLDGVTLELEAVAQNPHETIAEGLLNVIRGIQHFVYDPRMRDLMRLLIAEAQRFPSIASDRFASYKQMIKPVASFLQQAVDAGELTLSDPETAAGDLVILVLGGFSFLLSDPYPTPTEREQRARDVCDLLLRGWQGGNR